MPNWCVNTLVVEAKSKEALEKFISQVKSNERVIDFELVERSPKALEQRPEWCLNHWGTRYNCHEPYDIRNSDTKITYMFDTAWSPPLGVFAKLANTHKNLKFHITYSESEMEYQGEIKVEEGKIIYQRMENYQENND